MYFSDQQHLFGVPRQRNFKTDNLCYHSTEHENDSHYHGGEACLGVQRAGAVDCPSTNIDRDKASSNDESHREAAKNSMHCSIPAPLISPVSTCADLEQTYQSPRQPHEDAMDVVRQIVTLSLYYLA